MGALCVSQSNTKESNMLKIRYSMRAYKMNLCIYDGNPLHELKNDLVIVNNQSEDQTQLIEVQRSTEYMMIQIQQHQVDEFEPTEYKDFLVKLFEQIETFKVSNVWFYDILEESSPQNMSVFAQFIVQKICGYSKLPNNQFHSFNIIEQEPKKVDIIRNLLQERYAQSQQTNSKKTVSKRLSTMQLEGLSNVLQKKNTEIQNNEDNYEKEVEVKRPSASKRLSTIQLEGLAGVLARKSVVAAKGGDNYEMEVEVKRPSASKRLSTIQLEGLASVLAKKSVVAEKGDDNYEMEVEVKQQKAVKRLSTIQLEGLASVMQRKSVMAQQDEDNYEKKVSTQKNTVSKRLSTSQLGDITEVLSRKSIMQSQKMEE